MRQLWERDHFSAIITAVAVTLSAVAHAVEPVPQAPEAVAQRFGRIDRNADKQVSVEEYRAAVGAAQAGVALRDFDLFDRNADGQLSLDEYWSMPIHPAGQRGPLPDPMNEVVDQFVAILDQLLKDWDRQPERTVPLGEFLAEFTKTLEEQPTALMQREADPDRDRRVTRAEARRFVEIQCGIRRSDGKLLRLPDGRVVAHMQFVYADLNRDDRLDKTEYLERTYSGEKALELYVQQDADKDGFVTWDEWSKVRTQDPIYEFRRMDINLDGQLEPAELLAGTPDWIKISAKVAFPAFDRDRSGKLSLDEFRLTFHSNPVGRWHDAIADTDLDGFISRKEFAYGGVFPVLRFVYFEMLDTTRDGHLDPDEFVYNRKTTREVYAVNADGSGWQRLFAVEGFPSLGSPAISPDGTRIAFDGHAPGKTISEQIMFVADLDGGNLKQVGPGMMPSWSKNGRRLTYSWSGINVITVEGNESEKLASGWGAQWSPDGKRIGYYSGLTITTLDVETKKATAIYDGADGGFSQIYWNMKWSPDGKRICFKATKAGAETISSIDVDPANPRLKVHHTGTRISADIAWHPDGQRVAFSMFCPERGVMQIYELKVDSDDPPQLIKGQDPKATITAPCWTQDGKRLIVMTGDY